MSAGRYINLPAAILFLLLLAAFVACAFAMVSIATPEPGRPDGYLVLGGALVLGVSLGTAYEIAQARKGGKSPPLNRSPAPPHSEIGARHQFSGSPSPPSALPSSSGRSFRRYSAGA